MAVGFQFFSREYGKVGWLNGSIFLYGAEVVKISDELKWKSTSADNHNTISHQTLHPIFKNTGAILTFNIF